MPAKNSSGRRRRQDDCVRKLLDWCVDKHLISDVVPTDERYERLRQIVEQVPRWAAYYQRQAREPIEHRRLAEECAEIAEHLEKFLDRRGRAVLLRFTSSGLMLQNAYEICDVLTELGVKYLPPPPNRGGRPSDPWILGFVWGAASGWRELTEAKISSVGRFPQFVNLLFGCSVPDRDPPPNWSTVINTAIKRFKMDHISWMMPVANVRDKN